MARIFYILLALVYSAVAGVAGFLCYAFHDLQRPMGNLAIGSVLVLLLTLSAWRQVMFRQWAPRTFFPLSMALFAGVVGMVFMSGELRREPLLLADLDKLRDPATRQEEVARLLGGYHEASELAESRVFMDGKLHVVFATLKPSFSGIDAIVSGDDARQARFRTQPDLDPIRSSERRIFDSKGREVWPMGEISYVRHGYCFDFNGDGILDFADAENVGVDDKVEVFELRSIERNPKSLLRVLFNWHPKTASYLNDWGFTCFDENKDGIAEIAFGPATAIHQPNGHKFVFRWDAVKKCYSAGEIPPHSHIRVISPGQPVDAIAGGLGYPVITDPVDEGPALASQRSYVFESLKGRPDSELAAFFRGRKRPDTFAVEGEFPNRLPENLWELEPREAALRIAESNRTRLHRQTYQLAIDEVVAPPKSGWLVYDGGSSACYSYSQQLLALRFGVANPTLTVMGFNSIGAVGQNPWADQPARNVRVIPLSEAEARFIVETSLWLNRIRSYAAPPENFGSSSMSSTADGFGSLSLYPDQAAPRTLAEGAVWATSSISGRWRAEYDKTVLMNLSALFITEGIKARLGERWKGAPELERQDLVTSTEERLQPRIDEQARRQLSATYAALLEQSIPVEVLQTIVVAAGEQGFTELLPALQARLAPLPISSPEEKEFAEVKARVDANPAGEDWQKDFKRYLELEDNRKFDPTVLREPLEEAIERLQLLSDPSELKRVAASKEPRSRWALGQLHRMDPEAWANVVAAEFPHATPSMRALNFETLAVAKPALARRILQEITERDGMIVEIARFHLKHDVEAFALDVPVLMSLVREKPSEVEAKDRRYQAIAVLAQVNLPPEVGAEFGNLLETEIRQSAGAQFDTLGVAVYALSKLPPTPERIALIASTPTIAKSQFNTGFEALVRMTKPGPERQKVLTSYVRQCFTKSSGMMNEVFLSAFEQDLRGLKDEIAAFANEGPQVMDGDGADYGGGDFKTPVGQRYHIAREIIALWSEQDPVTLGRLGTFFAAAHPRWRMANDE